MAEFDRGDRVLTPYGKGTVAYKRMGPPTYSKAIAYSVVLDNRKNEIGYSSMVIPADNIFEADESSH